MPRNFVCKFDVAPISDHLEAKDTNAGLSPLTEFILGGTEVANT
jgi:hypothetical protein